jgi:selenocysteine lyase/cysteine desulfurase
VHPEFSLHKDVIYLNHAAVAPWPRRTADAVRRFAEENASRGAQYYPRWMQVEQALRKQLAQLIHAPASADIALLKSTSEGLSLIAGGLDWAAGDNIVSFDGEFPSNRIPWEALSPQGVTLRLAPLGAFDDPESRLFARCDDRTRLLSVSSVQYATGLRLDLERIGAFCRERGILFCVDAIQSLGALPFDVQAYGADFVVADGHKWMLGPEGLALFYCRAELRDRLRLQQFGWHMVEHRGDYDRLDWQPATDARRFECGSPNMLGIHGLHASLSLLLEVGIESVSRCIQRNTDYLYDLILKNGFEILSPQRAAQRSGITSFRIPGQDMERLHGALMQQGVICALRGGGIRFSPHFHTASEQLERAVVLVRKLAS